ncbi:hypothetical protein ACFVIM_24485 [Streptomyces sp. NPDC057638]|uniref:hypothetical protein n=1 Tax=Streptomyces sp. NPDC057638 TaxID=3346190 RepID=UPI0036BA82AC
MPECQTAPMCPTCDGLRSGERDAERVRDHSRATDCRVLLRRHQEADHQATGAPAAV